MGQRLSGQACRALPEGGLHGFPALEVQQHTAQPHLRQHRGQETLYGLIRRQDRLSNKWGWDGAQEQSRGCGEVRDTAGWRAAWHEQG